MQLNGFSRGGGGGQVHLKKIALRGWATGKYEYKGIGHTKVSGVYTKLHQTPPPHNEKINSLLYIYITSGMDILGGVHPLALARAVLFFMIKQKRQNEIQ